MDGKIFIGVIFFVAFSCCDGRPNHGDKEIKNIEKQMDAYAVDLGNYIIIILPIKLTIHVNILPQLSGRSQIYFRNNEISFRIERWSLRIISRNFLI